MEPTQSKRSLGAVGPRWGNDFPASVKETEKWKWEGPRCQTSFGFTAPLNKQGDEHNRCYPDFVFNFAAMIYFTKLHEAKTWRGHTGLVASGVCVPGWHLGQRALCTFAVMPPEPRPAIRTPGVSALNVTSKLFIHSLLVIGLQGRWGCTGNSQGILSNSSEAKVTWVPTTEHYNSKFPST